MKDGPWSMVQKCLDVGDTSNEVGSAPIGCSDFLSFRIATSPAYVPTLTCESTTQYRTHETTNASQAAV